MNFSGPRHGPFKKHDPVGLGVISSIVEWSVAQSQFEIANTGMFVLCRNAKKGIVGVAGAWVDAALSCGDTVRVFEG